MPWVILSMFRLVSLQLKTKKSKRFHPAHSNKNLPGNNWGPLGQKNSLVGPAHPQQEGEKVPLKRAVLPLQAAQRRPWPSRPFRQPRQPLVRPLKIPCEQFLFVWLDQFIITTFQSVVHAMTGRQGRAGGTSGGLGGFVPPPILAKDLELFTFCPPPLDYQTFRRFCSRPWKFAFRGRCAASILASTQQADSLHYIAIHHVIIIITYYY